MTNRRMESRNQPPAARFIGGVFGLVFLGIGLTVIGSLWWAPFGAFGSPPIVFRIFGSLIAVAFVAMGGTVAVGSILGRGAGVSVGADESAGRPDPQETAVQGSNKGYVCPGCGAPLGDRSEVSPHGDVKCAYCSRWFNVHTR